MKRSERFEIYLNKLIVPIRFSILSLLSEKKVSIFTNDLIKFMEFLYNYKYEDFYIFRKSLDEYELDDFL